MRDGWIAGVALLIAYTAIVAVIGYRMAKRARTRARRQDRQLREAARLASVGRVAAGIAHEIGNPLTGIANYTHILRARTSASPESDAALRGIEREVDRIERIVGGLLDFARPKSAAASNVDAADTLRDAVRLLADQGVLRSVTLNASIDEMPLALVGSEAELEQMFVNLLLNAIDAMNSTGTLSLYAGRTTPEALARAPRRSNDGPLHAVARDAHPRLEQWRVQHQGDMPCAKFVIADSGTGVAADVSERIFDPFFTTKPQGDGSGLGLAIVQSVIEAHRGVVWAQPAREGGAAFHVVLPLQATGSTRPPS